MKELNYFTISWDASDILVAGPAGAVSHLVFLHGRAASDLIQFDTSGYTLHYAPGFLPDLQDQLRRYLTGEPVNWQVRLELSSGSPFQRMVWKELQKIPYGQIVTYGQIAARLGKPGAMRAVGGANGANPVSIIIPCHRVIAANGGLGGYGGGLEVKRALLELEGISV